MKQVLLVLLIILLPACAHRSLAPVITDSKQYQQQLGQLDHWQLEGKIGVRHAGKSDSAALQWQQEGSHFDIFLSGPLGAGATRLTGTPEQLLIQDGDEHSTTASDPEQIIEKHLGWTLPLARLPRWILGCNEQGNARFNSDHTLAGFEQDGWQVNYLGYRLTGHWILPEKIVLKHEDMQVTIVIKHWDIH